jgi:hypothetical protein
MALFKPKYEEFADRLKEVPRLWNLQKLWSKGIQPVDQSKHFVQPYVHTICTAHNTAQATIAHSNNLANSLFFEDGRYGNTSEWRSLPHTPSRLIIQTSCPATGKIRNKRQIGIKSNLISVHVSYHQALLVFTGRHRICSQKTLIMLKLWWYCTNICQLDALVEIYSIALHKLQRGR